MTQQMIKPETRQAMGLCAASALSLGTSVLLSKLGLVSQTLPTEEIE